MTIKLTIGADPEFFLKDRTTRQNVSAHNLVPGTKDKPHKMPSGGAIQADGTAVEFNIPPSSTAKEFADNIRAALSDIGKFVPTSRFEFDFSPSVIYPGTYFDSIPENAKELGCDPDWSAYSMRHNVRPDNKTTMRTGAGHIHVGWTNGKDVLDPSHLWDCGELVKKLDLAFEHHARIWDTDTRRAKMYGARGAFRPKPYGCEYRVLSNAWLKYPKLWPWIFEMTKNQFEWLYEGRIMPRNDYDTRYNAVYGYRKLPPGLNIPMTQMQVELNTNTLIPTFPADFRE